MAHTTHKRLRRVVSNPRPTHTPTAASAMVVATAHIASVRCCMATRHRSCRSSEGVGVSFSRLTVPRTPLLVAPASEFEELDWMPLTFLLIAVAVAFTAGTRGLEPLWRFAPR